MSILLSHSHYTSLLPKSAIRIQTKYQLITPLDIALTTNRIIEYISDLDESLIEANIENETVEKIKTDKLIQKKTMKNTIQDNMNKCDKFVHLSSVSIKERNRLYKIKQRSNKVFRDKERTKDKIARSQAREIESNKLRDNLNNRQSMRNTRLNYKVTRLINEDYNFQVCLLL